MVSGIGIDTVDVPRFARLLARRASFAERVFSPSERADAHGAPARLAARFAAKEATMKALGVGLGAFDFHDVTVSRAESGAPTLVVSGRAAVLAAEQGVTRWLVSLTHTDLVAQAMVVAERDERDEAGRR